MRGVDEGNFGLDVAEDRRIGAIDNRYAVVLAVKADPEGFPVFGFLVLHGVAHQIERDHGKLRRAAALCSRPDVLRVRSVASVLVFGRMVIRARAVHGFFTVNRIELVP